MSSKYWANEDYGLYVTEEDLQEYADKHNLDVIDVGYDNNFNSYGEAQGECFLIVGEASFDADDNFLIASLNRFPSLFKAAYTDKDEALQELKDAYGNFLPKDFDYESKFVHFVGTTFG